VVKTKRVSAFLFFLLVSTALRAQPEGQPFLWKIKGEETSYLFGTVHLPDPRIAQFPAPVERAFEDSQAVYTEIPLDSASLMAQLTHLMLPGSTTLRDVVPPDLLQRTEEALRRVNSALTVAPFLKFKVWAVATMVSVLEKQMENPGALPMDARLYQRAEKEGKTVGSLETVEEQVRIFDSLSEEEQVKMLQDTLDFLDEYEAKGLDMADQLIEWYLRGNLAEFGELMVSYVRKDAFYEDFLDKVLTKRNYLMAERIGDILREHPRRSHFFAVGAGHYWGPTGLQNLLAKQGFTVTRAPLQGER
jgi:uncharacterized protein YbaP (TraB family)